MLIPGLRSLMRKRWKTGSIAASVFPVAVPDINRTFLPSMIFGISCRWGSVGLMNPLFSRSLLTGRQSVENAFSSVNANSFDDTEPRTIKRMLKD